METKTCCLVGSCPGKRERERNKQRKRKHAEFWVHLYTKRNVTDIAVSTPVEAEARVNKILEFS
jgi:hypothetical protein